MTLAEAAIYGAVLGLANAAHCAGMCGGFAVRAAAGTGVSRVLRFSAYQAGKAFTYLFIGAVAGWLGARALADSSPLRSAAGLLAAAVLFIGGAALLRTPRPSRIAAGFTGALMPLIGGLGGGGSLRGFSLGAVSGFIPCGVVYLAALEGVASGGVSQSVVLMGAFAVGTLPALGVVGFLGAGLLAWAGPVRARLGGGLILIITGIIAGWRALTPLLAEDGAAACCH